MDVTFRLAQRPEADALLGRSPLAVLVGMLLDQQVPMEWAFTGPYTIARRMGGDDLDAHEIAARDPEEFAHLLSERPAVHRYPSSMARRVQQLCQYLVDHYDGDAAALWRGVRTGREVLARIEALPGYGAQKSQILLALLGKRMGVTPEGWREAAGRYGDEDARRSAADITGPESLAEVRAFKQRLKQGQRRSARERTEKRAATRRKATGAPAAGRGRRGGGSGSGSASRPGTGRASGPGQGGGGG